MRSHLLAHLLAALAATMLAACAMGPTIVAPTTAPAGVATVKRTFDPASPIPRASSVAVPAGMDLIFISGMLPGVANRQAPAGSIETTVPTPGHTRCLCWPS